MKSDRLSIRIDPTELEEIKQSASEAGMTLAEFCLEAIRDKMGVSREAMDNISLHRRIKNLESLVSELTSSQVA